MRVNASDKAGAAKARAAKAGAARPEFERGNEAYTTKADGSDEAKKSLIKWSTSSSDE